MFMITESVPLLLYVSSLLLLFLCYEMAAPCLLGGLLSVEMDASPIREHHMRNVMEEFTLRLSSCVLLDTDFLNRDTCFYVVTSNNHCLNTMMKCIAVSIWCSSPSYFRVNI